MCRECLKNLEFFKLVLNFYFSPVFGLIEQGIYLVINYLVIYLVFRLFSPVLVYF